MNKFNYPYPILENDGDDIEGNFSFKLKVKIDPMGIKITPEFNLNNDELLDKIDSGYAFFFLQIKCSKTFYREIKYFVNKNPSMFQLNPSDFTDQIEFNAYIGSSVNINDYKLKTFHDDYKDYSFSLSKGDILAYGGILRIPIDKEYDDLFPVKSIMEIIPSENTDVMLVDFMSDKIVISLPINDYLDYFAHKKMASGIFHSSIVLPVLIEALNLLKDENLQNYKWNSILERLCSKKAYSLEDSKLQIAQKLLSYPFMRTLENIKMLEGR